MVRPGYKQTEVGVIPEDWTYCSVGNLVADGVIEKPLDGNHGNIHPKSSDYVPDGIPFIMANDFENDHVNLRSCHFIKKEQADKLQKGFAVNGDVLLTHKGTVGNVAILWNITSEYIMLTPQVTYYRVKDKKRLLPIFIKSYFENNNFQSILHNLSGGGTRAYIGIQKQLELPFILPSLPEQQAIAEALSDTDNLIAGLEKLIAKKQAIKTATMQQLLTGKTRLLGFGEGKGYKQTELGIVPEDWETNQLGSYVDINSGESPSRFSFSSEGIPYFKVEQLNNDNKYLTTTPYFFRSGKAIPANSIIFPKRGVSILLNKIRILANDSFMDTNLMTLTTANELSAEYLYYYLNFKGLSDVADTTSIPQINNKHIIPFKIPIPTFTEQVVIAAILSDLDSELEALITRLNKTKAIKQGMMQELLTGRTRLI